MVKVETYNYNRIKILNTNLNSINSKLMNTDSFIRVYTYSGSSTIGCQYRKKNGWAIVLVRSTNNFKIPVDGQYHPFTTLPGSCRPTITHFFPLSSLGVSALVTAKIDPNGVISLHAISFAGAKQSAYFDGSCVFPTQGAQ